MKKGVKIGLIVFASVAALTGSYFLFFRKKDEEETQGSDVEKCVIFPLKKGSGYETSPCSKDQVKKLQMALNVLAYAPLVPVVIDGKFGPKTEILLDALYQTKQVSEEMYNKITNPSKVVL